MIFTVAVTIVCHNFWDIKDQNAQLVGHALPTMCIATKDLSSHQALHSLFGGQVERRN